MNRIVIDTDPGIDDAHAILLAFAYPDTKVEALTTVAGNVALESTTRNALIVLDQIQQTVPVYAGCADALVVPTPRRAISHGTDGLGDSGYAPSARKAEAEHAALALLRLANDTPGELTLVALGPLTNIALALRLDPGLPEKTKRLVILGGAIHGMGNSWVAAAEFNFYVDPEAAAIVMRHWPGLTLVPWETAMNYGIGAEFNAEIERMHSPRAEFFRRIFGGRLKDQIKEIGVCYDPDPIAMAVALEPEIITGAESRYVEVELGGQQTRGQTVVDWFNLTGKAANATLVTEIDRERYYDLLRLSLR